VSVCLLTVSLFVCLFAWLSVCVSVCLFVCLSVVCFPVLKIGKYLVELQAFECESLGLELKASVPCISGTRYFLKPKILMIFFYLETYHARNNKMIGKLLCQKCLFWRDYTPISLLGDYHKNYPKFCMGVPIRSGDRR